MDPSVAKFGFDFLMGLGNRELQKAQVQAANITNAANTYARNLMRGANNELASKRGSLARFVQSTNNNRILKNTGSSMEAALVNYRRARDEGTKQSLEQQIGFAEAEGAQTAAAASSGLTGGVADLVAGTVALRRSRIEQAQSDKGKAMSFDAGKQQAAILAAGLSSLDQSTITDDIDYSVDTYVPQSAPGVGSVLFSALAGNAKGLAQSETVQGWGKSVTNWFST